MGVSVGVGAGVGVLVGVGVGVAVGVSVGAGVGVTVGVSVGVGVSVAVGSGTAAVIPVLETVRGAVSSSRFPSEPQVELMSLLRCVPSDDVKKARRSDVPSGTPR